MTFPDMNKHDDRVAERKHGPQFESAKRQAQRGVYVKRVYVVDNRREAKQKRRFRERDTLHYIPFADSRTHTSDQFNFFRNYYYACNVAIAEREFANKVRRVHE